MRKALIVQPGAFGDLFVCAPIAKWYHDLGFSVYWPITEKYLSVIKRFPYVVPVLLDDTKLHPDWLRSNVMEIFLKPEKYDKIINLADRGPHPMAQRLDENFELCKYRIAEVPFSEKNKLVWLRDEKKENDLFKIINPPKEFVIAHLSNSHGDEIKLPSEEKLPLIKIEQRGNFEIFDWYSLIIAAKRVYCVESSLHQFIDGFLKVPNNNYYLLKKGPVQVGTRHTSSLNWNLKYIGINSIVRG